MAAGQIDCQTRQPLPDAPIIRSVYTIHHGGTMSEENTDPIEGPYRSSGFGSWRRVSGRNYAAAYGHYGSSPEPDADQAAGRGCHARMSIDSPRCSDVH